MDAWGSTSGVDCAVAYRKILMTLSSVATEMSPHVTVIAAQAVPK